MLKLLFTLATFILFGQLNSQEPEQKENKNFKEWASGIKNSGVPVVDPIPVIDKVDKRKKKSNSQGKTLDQLFEEANATPNTEEYSYNTRDVSKKYPVTYKGVDNEEVYGISSNSRNTFFVILILIVFLVAIRLFFKSSNLKSQIQERNDDNFFKNTKKKKQSLEDKELSVTEKIAALKDLEDLLNKGIIDKEQFENMKSKLL
jgi:hypothetical protein